MCVVTEWCKRSSWFKGLTQDHKLNHWQSWDKPQLPWLIAHHLFYFCGKKLHFLNLMYTSPTSSQKQSKHTYRIQTEVLHILANNGNKSKIMTTYLIPKTIKIRRIRVCLLFICEEIRVLSKRVGYWQLGFEFLEPVTITK